MGTGAAGATFEDVEHYGRSDDWLPERKLFQRLLFLAIEEAQGSIVSTGWRDLAKLHEVRVEAQAWFRERSDEYGGWGYTIDILRLSKRSVERFEQMAFSNGEVSEVSIPLGGWGRMPRRPKPKGLPRRSRITDDEWEQIAPLVSRGSPRGRPEKYSSRDILNEYLAQKYRRRFDFKRNPEISEGIIRHHRVKWEASGAIAHVLAILGITQ